MLELEKKRVMFTNNDESSKFIISDKVVISEQGSHFYLENVLRLFLPNWCAYCLLDIETEIPEGFCLPIKK